MKLYALHNSPKMNLTEKKEKKKTPQYLKKSFQSCFFSSFTYSINPQPSTPSPCYSRAP